MGIRLENLVVKFGDFTAINDVTLQIPKGKLKYIVERYSLEIRMLQD